MSAFLEWAKSQGYQPCEAVEEPNASAIHFRAEGLARSFIRQAAHVGHEVVLLKLTCGNEETWAVKEAAERAREIAEGGENK